MSEPKTQQVQSISPAFTVVQNLLHQQAVQEELKGTMDVTLARRAQILERQAPEFVQVARSVGVEIEFLGMSPIPAGPRYYNGMGTGWVLAPATSPADAVVPRHEAQKLIKLERAGLWLPRIEVAHEVPEALAARIRAEVPPMGRQLAPAEAAELVGPIPPPAESVALGERMAEHSRQIAAALRRAGKLAIGAVTIPAEAASAVLAAVPLDPIVIGSIPSLSEKPGAPAAHFMLARWDW